MTTNVPKPVFGPRGFIAPSEAEVLVGVQEDMNEAFGGNLNLSLETPQGQLASSETAIIGNANDTFVFFTNQVDPAYAEGRMQDAIARLYFLERKPAEATVVSCECTGLVGTPILAGSQAITTDNVIYTSLDDAEIPGSGTITISFASTVLGPVSCAANTLNRIYKLIPGWDTINNPTEGVIGSDTETRAAFEDRRAASVALNSNGSLPSILGAVLSVSGVLDAYTTENDTSSPITINGVTLDPNSLYVAAVGGTNADVARAIWTRKAPGCAYTGNTTVVVTDNNPGYSPPYPTYNVKFQRPGSLAILFAVTILDGTTVPSNAAELIQNAIILAFSGGDGGPRARIGGTILASRFVAPVALLGSWAQIVSLYVGSNNTPTSSFTAAIAGTVMTVSAVVAPTIAVGQTVFGNGVAEGTIIESLGSGTGGTGTYNVSVSQTISSESMTGVVANLTSVSTNISQAPTISAANISVTVS